MIQFQYSITAIDESTIQSASDMITFRNTCRLPMISSLLIRGPNGLVPTNHVVGLYNGMIIDGECSHVQALNKKNFTKLAVLKLFLLVL